MDVGEIDIGELRLASGRERACVLGRTLRRRARQHDRRVVGADDRDVDRVEAVAPDSSATWTLK